MHDPNLHLLVDDHEIHHYTNLVRVLNRPRRRPEPMVIGDRPWEGRRVQAWGSVIREESGPLRMWYLAWGHDVGHIVYCYAESSDGTHWRKPALGVEERGGDRNNNIFYRFGQASVWELARRGEGLPARDRQGNVTGVLNNMDGMTVLRDEQEPDPSKRYKLIANMQDHRMWAGAYPEHYPDVTDEQIQAARRVWGQYLDTSPDGVHWAKEPRLVAPSGGGDYMMVTRDERNGRWWMSQRPKALAGRNAGLRYSDDLLHWTDPVEPVFVNGPDAAFGRLWEWHGGITPFNYGNMDLGFLERWANIGAGDVCELVCHRDGGRWERVAPGQPFLNVGPDGAWDRCLVYPTHNPPVRVGNELFIYYTGIGHGTKRGPEITYASSIGVMTIRLDRFAGLAHSRGEPGVLVTRPVEVTGDVAQVNAEPGISTQGVRVGLKNPDWSDIEGYALDECAPVTEDLVRGAVTWRGKDVSALRGRKVVLSFEVGGMTLYSYRFAGSEA